MSASSGVEIRELRTEFLIEGDWRAVVDGVSLSVEGGRTLGVVGESGSGKSVLCLSIVRLVPGERAGRSRTSGSVYFQGRDILSVREKEIRGIRGTGVGMVLQDPLSSLNPSMTVGAQLAEAVRAGTPGSRREVRERCVEALVAVGFPGAEDRLELYPHQLSGGMRQRVVIAIALACRPALLIADEPTTALDPTIQDQVLQLFVSLQRELGFGLVFVSHDLGVVAGMSDDICVMYAGQIMEFGPAADVLRNPSHPYTRALIDSTSLRTDERGRLRVIRGSVPTLVGMTTGCRFVDRCDLAEPRCHESEPPAFGVSPDRVSKCWLSEGEARG